LNRSLSAGGGVVGKSGRKIIIHKTEMPPIITNSQSVTFQSNTFDIYIPKGTPSTVPILIPPIVNPRALPFFSLEMNFVEAATAKGENKPAPVPAIALDSRSIEKVGAKAVTLFAIVKSSIDHIKIFLIGFPASKEENNGADIA